MSVLLLRRTCIMNNRQEGCEHIIKRGASQLSSHTGQYSIELHVQLLVIKDGGFASANDARVQYLRVQLGPPVEFGGWLGVCDAPCACGVRGCMLCVQPGAHACQNVGQWLPVELLVVVVTGWCRVRVLRPCPCSLCCSPSGGPPHVLHLATDSCAWTATPHPGDIGSIAPWMDRGERFACCLH